MKIAENIHEKPLKVNFLIGWKIGETTSIPQSFIKTEDRIFQLVKIKMNLFNLKIGLSKKKSSF